MTKPLNLDDPKEMQDWLSYTIQDSVDIDWSGKDGALAVQSAMEREGVIFARPAYSQPEEALIQEPKVDGFKTESPLRCFSEFKVSGNYALGKGFRPSVAHLLLYLDTIEKKEGWRFAQILGDPTGPTKLLSILFRK